MLPLPLFAIHVVKAEIEKQTVFIIISKDKRVYSLKRGWHRIYNIAYCNYDYVIVYFVQNLEENVFLLEFYKCSILI